MTRGEGTLTTPRRALTSRPRVRAAMPAAKNRPARCACAWISSTVRTSVALIAAALARTCSTPDWPPSHPRAPIAAMKSSSRRRATRPSVVHSATTRGRDLALLAHDDRGHVVAGAPLERACDQRVGQLLRRRAGAARLAQALEQLVGADRGGQTVAAQQEQRAVLERHLQPVDPGLPLTVPASQVARHLVPSREIPRPRMAEAQSLLLGCGHRVIARELLAPRGARQVDAGVTDVRDPGDAVGDAEGRGHAAHPIELDARVGLG